MKKSDIYKKEDKYNVLSPSFGGNLQLTSNVLTDIIMSTSTLSGNVDIDDFEIPDLILNLSPSKKIMEIKSEYGFVQYQSETLSLITLPTVDAKTGGIIKLECFRSQITFVVTAKSGKNYNIKIFKKNGSIQIPGVTNFDLIDEVVECVNCAVSSLTEGIKKMLLLKDLAYRPKLKTGKILSLFVVMKNYKLMLIKNQQEELNLKRAKQCLLDEKDPNITSVTYNSNECRMLVTFKSSSNNAKDVCVKLYVSGKINIIGSVDDEVTSNIYRTLESFFNKRKKEVVVIPGIPTE